MIKVSKVEEVKPPITVIANPFEMSVPEDVVTANGIRAAIVAKAVIKIGRKRVLPASTSDSRIFIPFSVLFWLIRSTNTIALVVTIPINIKKPIMTLTDNGSPAMTNPIKAPIGTKISDDRIINGILACPKVMSMVK